MADRLINEDAVLALLDSQIEAAMKTAANPLAKSIDKAKLEAVIFAMQMVTAEVQTLPSSEYTEADLDRMADGFVEPRMSDECDSYAEFRMDAADLELRV